MSAHGGGKISLSSKVHPRSDGLLTIEPVSPESVNLENWTLP